MLIKKNSSSEEETDEEEEKDTTTTTAPAVLDVGNKETVSPRVRAAMDDGLE